MSGDRFELMDVMEDAVLDAVENDRKMYVFQAPDGAWLCAPVKPADDPYIELDPQTFVWRLGCDYCESSKGGSQR